MAREGRGRPLGQDGGEARATRPKARRRGAVARDEAKPQPDSASPGGPVIRMGRMETPAQFHARVTARRGTRAIYDEALAWARDALDSGLLAPFQRAGVEADRALVLAALHGDPLGVIEPSPGARAASARLIEIGHKTRLQRAIEKETKQRGTAKARAERSGRDSRAVIKRRDALKAIVADLKRRGKRVTAQRAADELAKITDKTGKRVYPYASRRTVADDLKRIGED